VPDLEVNVLTALGGDVRVTAAHRRKEAASAIGALSSHKVYWCLIIGGWYKESKYIRRRGYWQACPIGLFMAASFE